MGCLGLYRGAGQEVADDYQHPSLTCAFFVRARRRGKSLLYGRLSRVGSKGPATCGLPVSWGI